MDQISLSLKALFAKPTLTAVWAIGVAVFSHIFGLVDGELMMIVFYFVIIDTLTGLFAAGAEGQPIISRKLFRSVVKVVVYFSFIGIAGLIGRICLNGSTHALCVDALSDGMFQTMALLWVMAMELKSINENFGRLGYKVPQVIEDRINTLFSKGLAKSEATEEER
jgi:phage-related holin